MLCSIRGKHCIILNLITQLPRGKFAVPPCVKCIPSSYCRVNVAGQILCIYGRSEITEIFIFACSDYNHNTSCKDDKFWNCEQGNIFYLCAQFFTKLCCYIAHRIFLLLNNNHNITDLHMYVLRCAGRISYIWIKFIQNVRYDSASCV